MRHWTALIVFFLSVAIDVAAQPLSMRFQEGSSHITTHFDGETVTVVDFTSDGRNTMERRSSAALNAVDLGRSRVKNVNGYSVLELWCKSDRPCFRQNDYERLIVSIDATCPTREECNRFLDHLRNVACNSLRATYGAALPPECRNDPASTYRPGKAPTPPPVRPE